MFKQLLIWSCWASFCQVPYGATLGYESAKFVQMVMKYFLRSFSPFRWFKKGSCQFLAKECAKYWVTAWRTWVTLLTAIPEYYQNTGIPLKNTGIVILWKTHLLKTPILVLINWEILCQHRKREIIYANNLQIVFEVLSLKTVDSPLIQGRNTCEKHEKLSLEKQINYIRLLYKAYINGVNNLFLLILLLCIMYIKIYAQ